MKTLKQMLFGFLFSIITIILVLFLQVIEIGQYAVEMVWGLYILTIVLAIIAIILRSQIISLNNKTYEGELEDEIEIKKYRKFSDMSLSIQLSAIIAIIGLSVSLMIELNTTLLVTGILLITASYILGVWIMNITHKMYPERNLPKITEEKYEEKLLNLADEGERHVMLQGLYKSYNLLNLLLIFGILATAIYSAISENSQLFSVIIMGLVLIAVNSRYMFAIRNK